MSYNGTEYEEIPTEIYMVEYTTKSWVNRTYFRPCEDLNHARNSAKGLKAWYHNVKIWHCPFRGEAELVDG